MTDTVESTAQLIPWEVIGGGSAALLVAGLSIYMLRSFLSAMTETRREFTAALQRLADDFGDRVEGLTKSVIESNNRVERTVADAMRERGDR